MSEAGASGSSIVEWAWAGAPVEGHRSGDAHVVAQFPGGVLVAAIDGLGHGPEAADAADEAVRVLREFAADPLPRLIDRCHERLRKTRGVVLCVASFDARASTMTWASVGNVEALLLRRDPAARPPRESVSARGGVVGYQLPPVRPVTLSVSAGDLLVLATDGIRSAFVGDLVVTATPSGLARTIFERHARGSDDALVLVARYVGAEVQ
jgi:negative regulator of sigma-B (phosphoserine phosphatase)